MAFENLKRGNMKIYPLLFIAVGFILIGSKSFSEEIFFSSLKLVPRNIDYDGDWSPDSQNLVFISNRNGPYNVYIMGADGSKIQRLTFHKANDDQPSFSPDGKKIAFTSDIDGNTEIYTIDTNGKNLKRLTFDEGYDIHPFWSPDGKKIIFNSTRTSKNKDDPEAFEIYVMNADGSGKIRLTKDGGVNTYAAFSPDGKTIVFRKIIEDNNSEIYVMNIDGSGLKNLSNHPSFDGWPYWSPDGSKITFASNRDGNYEIFLMEADGTKQSKFFSGPGRQTVPRISPDGTKLTFTRSANGEARILVLGVEVNK